jgi:hypothetical protein
LFVDGAFGAAKEFGRQQKESMEGMGWPVKCPREKIRTGGMKSVLELNAI